MANEVAKYEQKEVTPIPTYDRILEMAINQGAPLEQLEKFLQIKREYESQEAKKLYSAAMARVHEKMPSALKTADNPHTRSKYAELGDIINIAKPIYAKEGFFVTFYEEDSPKEDHVRIMMDMSHSDGHTQTYHYDAPMEGRGIKGNSNMTPTHAKAASVTYGRRYLLCMVLNIPTVDDDGNSANPPSTISEEQAATINLLLEETGANKDIFLKYYKVDRVEDLPVSKYAAAAKALEGKKNPKEKK